MSEIVIGYDGRPGGEDALALGRLLCETIGARPLVVIVVPFPEDLLSRKDLDQVLSEAEERLGRASGKLAGLEPETRALIHRSPSEAMHELAEEREPAAIVVGSSHRGPVGRVLLGTSGASLLAGAPCPVAVAPRDYARREDAGLRRLGVAIDGSEQSWPALRGAAAIAKRTGAALTILGVVEPATYGYGEAFELLSAGEYESARHRQMEEAVERAASMVPPGIAAEQRIMTGSPSHLLAEAAEDFDLLVVGSRGYGPVRRVLLGSVSTALVRTAPCPVLVVPEGAESGLGR
jgi:nucleotide-binding universal stress UspA family protein